MENPSTKILIEYFKDHSIASKAYRTQGGEDPLFQEMAHVLLEYGFVNPRPRAMLKNRAGFIIATFEGVKVDWPIIVEDALRVDIQSVIDGKKAWCGLTQWLTLLVTPTHTIKPKKRAQLETTLNKASKR